ncbi:MAG: TrkA family potassium uptake protein [Muricomes sp.]
MLKEDVSESYGIIGLGRFGTALAQRLAEAGKEVIVVDRNENRVKALRNYTDFAYVADELTREVLEEIGIQNCDTVVVCIGEHVDTCILVTLNVVNMGVKRVIAKATSRDQGEVLEKIGAEVVYPEWDMAIRLASKLLVSSVTDYISLENNMEIAKVPVYHKMVGKSVQNIRFRQRFGLNIIAVEHGGKTNTEVEPEYIFETGDVLIVIGSTERISRFEENMLV